MKFLDRNHRRLIKDFERLWASIERLSKFGRRYDVEDIFQDNGGKILQQAVYLNFKNLPKRVGNDAIDELGIEWEMKSANIELVTGFSTHHHLNYEILKKYRSVPWSFATYEHTHLKEIYVMSPNELEPLFQMWEKHLKGKKIYRRERVPAVKSINNPKIPIKFVQDNGHKVYPFDENTVNPIVISKRMKKGRIKK